MFISVIHVYLISLTYTVLEESGLVCSLIACAIIGISAVAINQIKPLNNGSEYVPKNILCVYLDALE